MSVEQVIKCDRCKKTITQSGTFGVSEEDNRFTLGAVDGDLCFSCLENIIDKAAKSIIHNAGS